MHFICRKWTIVVAELCDPMCQKRWTCLKTLRTGRVLNLVVVALCLLNQGKRIMLSDIF